MGGTLTDEFQSIFKTDPMNLQTYQIRPNRVKSIRHNHSCKMLPFLF